MKILLHRTQQLLLLAALAMAAGLAQAAPPPGMPDIGLPFGNYFAVMKAKLNLTAEQDAQYTIASRATQVAMEAARKARTASAVAAKAEQKGASEADPSVSYAASCSSAFSSVMASRMVLAVF